MSQKNEFLIKKSLPNLSLSLHQITDITKDIKDRERKREVRVKKQEKWKENLLHWIMEEVGERKEKRMKRMMMRELQVRASHAHHLDHSFQNFLISFAFKNSLQWLKNFLSLFLLSKPETNCNYRWGKICWMKIGMCEHRKCLQEKWIVKKIFP